MIDNGQNAAFFVQNFPSRGSPSIKHDGLAARLNIIREKSEPSTMATTDRIGIDVVTAPHDALLHAKFVDLRSRRKKEDQSRDVAGLIGSPDKTEQSPARKRRFDTEGFSRRDQLVSPTDHFSYCTSCRSFRVIWPKLTRDIVCIQKRAVVNQVGDVFLGKCRFAGAIGTAENHKSRFNHAARSPE